jgi:hypothetical protein
MTPELEATLRASVAALLDGRFSAHGVEWPKRDANDLFPRDLWRLDPVTGKLWPGADVYCFDLKYRHARDIGDVKFVWDLNRLQFLLPLAAAGALWNDMAAIAAIETAVASWAEANPPFGGLGWNSGIELSLRAVTLILVVALCGPSLSEVTQRWISQILAAHLYWSHRYPSLFSSANNHLVAEALGEFAIATVLPTAPHAAAIGKHARAVLEREAGLQIFPDGVPAEQSPSYGGFTAEMLLVAGLIAESFGKPLSTAVSTRLKAYADFIGALGDARGRVPNIGDDDEGRVLTLSAAREYGYPGSVARAIAGYCGTAPRIARSTDDPELRDAFFRPANADAITPDGVLTFEAGGYTVIRERRAGHQMRMTIDHGPLGYLSIAAHGHADANAITLSLDGEDIFVDPGTYLYHSGGAWRDWFRGTGAHNTLRLADVDQSIISGPFNWAHRAKGRLDQVSSSGPDWSLTARHDGYSKRFGVDHQRKITATPSGFVMEDRLIGKRSEAISEVVFQLAPGLSAQADGKHWTVGQPGQTPLVTLAFSHKGEVSAVSGGTAPGSGGWVSHNFGDKVEAVRFTWRGILPTEGLTTTISWA